MLLKKYIYVVSKISKVKNLNTSFYEAFFMFDCRLGELLKALALISLANLIKVH